MPSSWFGYEPADGAAMETEAERRLIDALGTLSIPADVTVHQCATTGCRGSASPRSRPTGDLLVVGVRVYAAIDTWRLGLVAHAVVQRVPVGGRGPYVEPPPRP